MKDFRIRRKMMQGSRLLHVLSVFLFLLFSSSLVNAATAKILVISAHPDDDILTASGVVYRALQRGDSVKVVYITNGDYTNLGTGYARQGEAVTAQSYTGMTEDKLIFLGYPDGYLKTIYDSYITSAQTYTTPNNNQSVTYGNRGLGSADYHFYKFGSHANYNRDNIVQDLESIITDFKPDHIFTLADFDQYPDHSTTYALMKLALTTAMTKDTTYNPTIHKTCVWWTSTSWPNPIDPTSFFSELPDFLGISGLNWSDRESLDVPLVMQSSKYMTNKKFLAIAAHDTQGGAKSYGQFVHKDEIFWTENYAGSNKPPVPNAGLDQSVSEGVMVHLDGSGSHDPNADALTFQWVQAGGIPVTLSNQNIFNPTFNAPTGLKQDEVLTFELVVKDGNLSSVPDSVNVIVRATNPDPYANRNIAPYALVTASSENAQTGQLATKAIDGFIDGSGTYPGDVTKEWVTFGGEKAGAWLQLNWSSPYKVNRVTLYDRPNSCDQILTATLNFDDGTTLQVGPLDNFGGATEHTFTTPITVTNLRMTVTAVSSCTQNIGLAEIEVYGVPAGMQDSQTTISSSTPNPSIYGSPVTFTATVTSGATGTVTFMDNALPLAGGIVTLPSGTSGTVTFSTSALTGGTHSITAVYNGDTYHNPSTSNALSRTVSKPATTTNLASSPNPSTYGSPATFTATVAPSTATGTVTFMDGGATLGIGNLSGGTATLNTSPSLGGGIHSLTAVYSGDTNYVGSSSSPYAHTVSKANQTISNLASTLTKTFGVADFALGATASSNLPVSYTSSNTLVATIVSNQVHIVAAGTVTITASQAGDTNYNAAPNVTQTLTVNRANQTISNLASSLTKTFGDADYAPGATASSGLTVSYLSSNTAVATISGSNIHIAGVGSTTITALQAGNANYNAAPNVTQNLTVKPAPTSTSISAPAIKSGENGTVAVTVISGILMPTGNVYLTVDKGTSKEATQIGSVTTGTATFTITSPSPGTHTLDATYNAQGNFGASSANGQLSVDLVVTTTTITPPAPVTYGANGSVTVTVSSGAGTPAGSVSLKVDNTTLPAQVLNNGSTTFTITSPSAGSRALSASYTAQGNFGASSTTGTLIVNKANQTISNLAPSLTKSFGDADFAPGATANSGLAVSYASSNTLVATIVSNQIHIVAAGTATITASQTGDTNYNAAPNVTQTLTVNRAQTMTSVASSSPTSTYGSSVTFTATVTPSTATGTVTFMNGTNTLGTGSLSGGTATLNTSSLGGGIYSITAVYGGDANFAASTTLSGINQDVLPDGKLDGGSDVVSINDALKALRIAAGIDPLEASDLVHGDVSPLVNSIPNSDGKIDIDDVVVIMRKAANLPSW